MKSAFSHLKYGFVFVLFSLILIGCFRRERSSCTGWDGGRGHLTGVKGRTVPNYDQEGGIELRSDIELRGGDEMSDETRIAEISDSLIEVRIERDNLIYSEFSEIVHSDVASDYERYNSYLENEWVLSAKENKSTFSIDVDKASYTNFRRFVNNGKLPPKSAIRMEEWLNFFNYDLPAPDPSSEDLVKISSEIGECPWNKEDDLVMIKLQGRLPSEDGNLPPSNLVFLLDVSGSMNEKNKLPLVQESLITLVNELRTEDNVSIVTYAGESKIVLQPTSGAEKKMIIKAINGLSAGGGTAGSKGIETAYKLAEKNFNPEGNNRIIIASDGDWNIGTTDDRSLIDIIAEKKKTGIYLSVLGFGMHNLNDAMMEQLADNGNGNYAYIDSEKEANRLFKSEFAGSLHVIANDVKIQIDFDSTVVESYRLLGYENRVLENWQFDDDGVDAGDLGMGQNVVAFYQIKRKNKVDQSIGKVDFRLKPRNQTESLLISHKFGKRTEVSSDFKFASCVVEYALCLRESEHRNEASMGQAILRGRQNLGNESDLFSYEKRVEFVGLMTQSAEMWTGYVFDEAPEKKVDKAPKLKMYPNPATDYITIEVPELLSKKWSVQIFSANGKLEMVKHFQENKAVRIDINQLISGSYIVKIYGEGYNYGYLRLVVQ